MLSLKKNKEKVKVKAGDALAEEVSKVLPKRSQRLIREGGGAGCGKQAVGGARAPGTESRLRARTRHQAGPRHGRKGAGPRRESAANKPTAGDGCEHLLLARPRCGFKALLSVAVLKRTA